MYKYVLKEELYVHMSADICGAQKKASDCTEVPGVPGSCDLSSMDAGD